MDTSTTPILDLDGNPLDKIVSYLDTPKRLKLIAADKRFVGKLKDYLTYDLIDMSIIQENFEVAETKDILSKCGPSIKRIHFEDSMDNSHDEYHKLVSIYCRNLEELDLVSLEVTDSNTYGQLLTTCKQIRILRLRECTIDIAGSSVISALTQLETLDLSNSTITGNHLNSLRNLFHLNLQNCRNFELNNLISIFNVIKLKTLNIALQRLSDDVLTRLVETQTDLDHVTVTHKYGMKSYEKVCKLKNLRELTIHKCEENHVVGYLKEFVKEQKHTLECLDIHFIYHYEMDVVSFMEKENLNRMSKFRDLRILGLSSNTVLKNAELVSVIKCFPDLEMVDIGATTFTDNGIIGCVENLDQLQFLDISYCRVEKRLYNTLVEIRQEKKCHQPLIVFIQQESALASWFKTECYDECKHVVRLSLEPMRSHYDKGLLQRITELKEKFRGRSYDIKLHQRILVDVTNSISLANINDNCLYHIMSFLNFSEKILMVLSSDRFDDIFRQFLSKDQFDMSEMFRKFTIREIRTVLQRFGVSIKKLYLKTSQNYFDIEYHRLAAKYCANLQELHCKRVDMETIKEILIFSAKTLTTVKLIGDGIAREEVLQQISQLENLKVLHLNDVYASGDHLGRLSKLVELDLGMCSQFQSKNFEAICKANKLRVLNIYACDDLDNAAFQMLLDTQTDLERLTIGRFYKGTITVNIGKLRKLVDLRLHKCHCQNIKKHLRSFIDLNPEQIRFLEVDYLLDFSRFEFLPALTDSVASELKENILQFRNLIYLSLPENTIVDNGFVQRLVKACPLLEILNFRRSNRLSGEGVVTAVEELQALRHFDIHLCTIDNPLSTYQRILEIMRDRNIGPLTLYVEEDEDDVMLAFSYTKEYQNTKKYVVLSDECVGDLNLEKYQTERLRPCRQFVASVVATNYETTVQPSIMDLPASYLSRLLPYLDVTDQLKLALLNERFYELMQPSICDAVFDMSAISQCFTLSEARKILAKFADHVKRIHFLDSMHSKPLDYFNLIKPYFPQLVEIEINNCDKAFFRTTEELFASSRNLKVAKFKNCRHENELVPFLCNNKQLEVLDISSSSVYGEHIKDFTNLVELNLACCDMNNPEYDTPPIWHFAGICENLKLKSLDIRFFDYLDDETIELLVKTQTDLERLSISTCYADDNDHITQFCQLKNLKHLRIHDKASKPQIPLILDKLLRYRKDELLSLTLKNDIDPTGDYRFYDIVQNRIKRFRNLQKVKIHQKPIYFQPFFLESVTL